MLARAGGGVRLVVVAAILLLLVGCSSRLVTNYDATLVAGLNKANVEALTLFSAVSGGSPQSQFDKYSGTYDTVIASLEALRAQASAREVPVGQLYLAKIKLPGNPCADTATDIDCLNSSPGAIDEAVLNLTEMRDRHRARGIGRFETATFKRAFLNSMDQALTVEMALER